MAARPDRSREPLERCRRTLEDLRVANWLVSCLLAEASLWPGRPRRSRAQLRPPYDPLQRLGEKSHFSPITHALAVALDLQERSDEAESSDL